MADEKEGPYKVVSHLVSARERFRYSIVVEQKQGFLKELIPDAGDSQTARQVCNLLNKNYREVRENLDTGKGWQTPPGDAYDFSMGVEDDEAGGTDGGRLDRDAVDDR